MIQIEINLYLNHKENSTYYDKFFTIYVGLYSNGFFISITHNIKYCFVYLRNTFVFLYLVLLKSDADF